MSMRPVDMQIIVPRTTEATRIQQSLKEGNETQQSALTVQFQEQLREKQKKVYEKTKPEKILKESDNNGHKYKKEKKTNQKRNKGDKAAHVDIRI